MKLKMAADQVLKRFSRQIRKEDAFRPTPVDSPACNNGCIAIDAYPEIINDRRRGPDSWIINTGYPLLFIDQNITCPSECVIAGPEFGRESGILWSTAG